MLQSPAASIVTAARSCASTEIAGRVAKSLGRRMRTHTSNPRKEIPADPYQGRSDSPSVLAHQPLIQRRQKRHDDRKDNHRLRYVHQVLEHHRDASSLLFNQDCCQRHQTTEHQPASSECSRRRARGSSYPVGATATRHTNGELAIGQDNRQKQNRCQDKNQRRIGAGSFVGSDLRRQKSPPANRH